MTYINELDEKVANTLVAKKQVCDPNQEFRASDMVTWLQEIYNEKHEPRSVGRSLTRLKLPVYKILANRAVYCFKYVDPNTFVLTNPLKTTFHTLYSIVLNDAERQHVIAALALYPHPTGKKIAKRLQEMRPNFDS